MTRGEAIRELREDKALYETDNCHAGDGSPDGDLLEALDMAIEALRREEAEEKGWCHRIRPKNVEVVVRCKDCRFAMVRTLEEMNKPIKPQPILCEWFCIGVENNDYCSYGERREPDKCE